MSATKGSERGSRGTIEALPNFELSYLFDNRDAPSEVTIFPESDNYDISTNWITVDKTTAVPLEDLR